MNRLVRVLTALTVVTLLATSCEDGVAVPTSSSPAAIAQAAEEDPTEARPPSAANSSPSDGLALPSGDYTFELRQGWRNRSYIVHIPASASGPVPLVIGLHGGGSTGEAFRGYNGLDLVADREGFVTVYPEGTGILRDRLHTWNSGLSCCGFALDRDIDDVAFLRDVIIDLSSRIDVDAGRVYMTGHSNGAMMAYRFANEVPEMVTAIAPVAGAPDLGLIDPQQPVAVLHIHSLDDPRAIYDGGEGPPFPGTDRTVNHEPVRKGISAWAAAIGCDANPTTAAPIAGEAENAGHSRQLIIWSDCEAESRVEHLLLTGTGHGWPGVEVEPAWIQDLMGDPTTIVNASEEVWAFVSQFER